jgi:chromosome segregation ATPase
MGYNLRYVLSFLKKELIMGRIGISYQDVAATIPKLQAQSKSPTVDNIREVLGTGSKSTIARLLREWKQQQGLANDDNGSLPSELLIMVKELWLRLQTKADEAIDSHQQECDETLRESQQQLTLYKAKENEWQSRVQSLEVELHQQKEENKYLNAALISEQQEKIKITERAQSLQFHQLGGQSENERLHQLLKNAQANLEHYQTETQQLRSEQEIIIEKQRQEVNVKGEALEVKIRELIEYRFKLEMAASKIAGLEKALSTAEERIAALNEDYLLVSQERANLAGQVKQLQVALE